MNRDMEVGPIKSRKKLEDTRARNGAGRGGCIDGVEWRGVAWRGAVPSWPHRNQRWPCKHH